MAAAIGSFTFETAIGTCGIAWSAKGIAGVLLPGDDLEAALKRKFPEARPMPPPSEVQEAITSIARLLDGEMVDLSAVAIDMENVAELDRRILSATRQIRPGETRTYGEIAKELGDPLLAQAVGQAMARNPFPIIVPCHRVLASGGKAGGFSAPGGISTKFRILQIEQAQRKDEGLLFDNLPLAVKSNRH